MHRWLGHVLRHENFIHDIIEGKMMDRATRVRREWNLLHDITEERECKQLKHLISDKPRCRHDSK